MKKMITGFVVAAVAMTALSGCAVDESSSANGTTNDTTATGTKANSPKYTVAQQSAIRSAKQYLSMSGFSRSGLIRQLSSKAGDGYKRADAVFAVNHIKVNWNKQAVRSAKEYLSMSGFSRSGLIQQLSSNAGDAYTVAQATYAANHVGL